MLFINNPSLDVYFNLAVEEYLLKNHSENIFMLWQDRDAVVLGKYQNVRAEIDGDFVAKQQIAIARRCSGGGTVYHDRGNINLTFIENTERINFDKYARQILDFLYSVGIQAWADERRAICIGRFKISGSAQCVYKNRVLYHCTLLYSTDLDRLRLSLNGSSELLDNRCYVVKSVKSEVVNLCNYLPDSPGIGDFKRVVFDYFFKSASENRIYDLTPEDLSVIELLKNKKYATTEWIWDGSVERRTSQKHLDSHSRFMIRRSN